MSKQYRCKPSELVGIQDTYTAFCFNEACSYVMLKLDSGEQPVYPVLTESEKKQKEFKNFKDFYKQYE